MVWEQEMASPFLTTSSPGSLSPPWAPPQAEEALLSTQEAVVVVKQRATSRENRPRTHTSIVGPTGPGVRHT